MKQVAMLIAALLLLAGCKDYGRCLASHEETITTFINVGSGTVMTLIPIVSQTDVCDRWEFPEGRP